MSTSSADSRDYANIQRFLARSQGRRAYAPSIARAPGNALCDCYVDPTSGRSYCVCSAIITTDMPFAPDVMSAATAPRIRFASPCERSALARQRAFIAKSMA